MAASASAAAAAAAAHSLHPHNSRPFSFPPIPTPTPLTTVAYRTRHRPPLRLHSHDPGDSPIGDCLVFDDDAFEDDVFKLFSPSHATPLEPPKKLGRRSRKKAEEEEAVKEESLVPEKWKEAVAEINLGKKERQAMRRELKFGSRADKKEVRLPAAIEKEYLTYREMKLRQLRPVVLDDPGELPVVKNAEEEEERIKDWGIVKGERAAPRNPRLELDGEGLDNIRDFFNSGQYVPGEVSDDKKTKGSRKLFTQEEKILLNRKIPNIAEATSRKWLPLHTLAASGEFYLLDALLKHNVDINATDMDGLCAIHKAILGKKQAILNYLLRESANPFVRDNDGATLLHYAVQTASSQAIKTLLLYDVDINLADNDGWTPLHLAVQTQRSDIVKLLLIKGADKTLKNRDGSTPLELCLYFGGSARTYELIKMLKELPRRK